MVKRNPAFDLVQRMPGSTNRPSSHIVRGLSIGHSTTHANWCSPSANCKSLSTIAWDLAYSLSDRVPQASCRPLRSIPMARYTHFTCYTSRKSGSDRHTKIAHCRRSHRTSSVIRRPSVRFSLYVVGRAIGYRGP